MVGCPVQRDFQTKHVRSKSRKFMIVRNWFRRDGGGSVRRWSIKSHWDNRSRVLANLQRMTRKFFVIFPIRSRSEDYQFPDTNIYEGKPDFLVLLLQLLIPFFVLQLLLSSGREHTPLHTYTFASSEHRKLTGIKKDDGFKASEFGVVDLHLVQRLHQLVHHPDADLADIQILIATLCGQRYDW